MISAYTSAATIASKKRNALQATNFEHCLGILHQIYGHGCARAARHWERVINTYRGSRSQGDIAYVLEATSIFLATHYLTQAMEVVIDTVENRRSGDMLELLAQGKAIYPSDITDSQGKSTQHADRFVTNEEVGLILGN